MAQDDIFNGRRASGSRPFLFVAPLLAILLVAGCRGCIAEPPPKEISQLKEKGWSVQQLTDLITVEKTGCTDADLKTLAEYAQALQKQKKDLEIVLAGSKVTDAGLTHIKSLANVRVLNASKTAVTGQGLAAIAGWTNLKSLDLSETKIDDDGLAHLSKLVNLNSLTLSGCSLTGAGLGSLKDLAELQSLRLDKTQVDDAGLAKLPPLAKLKNLRLNETRITDASLEHVQGLPALQELWIQKAAGISDAGVKTLEAAKPDLVIER